MPRYFFDIRDGEYIPDHVGCEVPNLEAARIQAVVRSADLLKANPSKFWDGEEWQLEVRDEACLILFIPTFMATNSPRLAGRGLSRRTPDGAPT
ncbi:hypothetical protein [Phenylobacterium sp.]|uniref:DUF6894 family protein n=1 Tax=Phenylobacterium sp. TaxID=1871053 RepID=UPI0025D0A21C|nr:hypothetical protein [Phenylobacterium sp.]